MSHLFQMLSVTYPRKHEDLGGADSSSRQDHLPRSFQTQPISEPVHLNPHGPPLHNQYPGDMGVGHHCQVSPNKLFGKGPKGACPEPLVGGGVRHSETRVLKSTIGVPNWISQLFASFQEDLHDWISEAFSAHFQLSTNSMKVVFTRDRLSNKVL